MTRSVGQLDKDRMMNRLPDIARSMRTYFVQLQRNVMPVKKVIDQLKQSYPETMTDGDLIFLYLKFSSESINFIIILEEWKAHFHLLQEKVPHWIVTKTFEGIEHIRINKKIEFEETVIKTLKNTF